MTPTAPPSRRWRRRLVGALALALLAVPAPAPGRDPTPPPGEVGGGLTPGGPGHGGGSAGAGSAGSWSDGAGADLWAEAQFGAAPELDGAVGAVPVVGGARRLYPHVHAVTVDHAFSHACAARGLVLGRLEYWRVERRGAEPRLVTVTQECVPAPTVAPVPSPDAPGAPTATTVAEAVRRRLPRPHLGIAPHPGHGGITGLQTHLWHDTAGLVPVDHDGDRATPARPGARITASAGPWRVTAAAAVVGWRWTITPLDVPAEDLPAPRPATRAATRPGTPDRPAVRHTFTRSGAYRLTLATRWTGAFTWTRTDTGQRGTSPAFPSVRVSSALIYRVDQVRAVPVRPVP